VFNRDLLSSTIPHCEAANSDSDLWYVDSERHTVRHLLGLAKGFDELLLGLFCSSIVAPGPARKALSALPWTRGSTTCLRNRATMKDPAERLIPFEITSAASANSPLCCTGREPRPSPGSPPRGPASFAPSARTGGSSYALTTSWNPSRLVAPQRAMSTPSSGLPLTSWLTRPCGPFARPCHMDFSVVRRPA